MNRRIRKKREKQQLARAIRELVALAEKRQQKRQEAIDRFLTAYSATLPSRAARKGGRRDERLQNAGSSHADAYHNSCRRGCGMGCRAAFGELSKRR